MSNITPEQIRDLRERTGVGVTKCKEALTLAEGDMQKAIEHLRKVGLASSVKKEGRETKEGIIGAHASSKAVALVEVNSETDFVAKNTEFVNFVQEITKQAAENRVHTLKALLEQSTIRDPLLTVDGWRNLLIQKIGENIQIKRLELIDKLVNSSYGVYSHMNGKIVTVVEIEGSPAQQQLAYDIAMHVAAEDPQFLKPEDISDEVRQKEREIARFQSQGKPENILEKIVEARVKAYADQVCLVGQKYVKDPKVSVQQYVEEVGKKAGAKLRITRFWRWKVGQ